MIERLTFKRVMVFFSAVLMVVGLRMHIDPAGMTMAEFPNANGSAFTLAVINRHILGSLVLSIACVSFFASKIADTRSQQLILNGFLLAFVVLIATLGVMTAEGMGHFISALLVFSVLTMVSLIRRLAC